MTRVLVVKSPICSSILVYSFRIVSSFSVSMQCPPEKSGNTPFFSAFSPTVHTNPSRKRSFSKTLFKLEEFENAGFAFSRRPRAF